MTPSTGQLEPAFARALFVKDAEGNRVGFVSADVIGMDGKATALAVEIARSKGLQTPLEDLIFLASHSHSGTGAVTADRLWELAPATDMLVPELQEVFANGLAAAMLQAEQSMQPATVGLSNGKVLDLTSNRRAGRSPYVTPSSIDPNLGIIRVDAKDGTPIGTLWNFAIHGVCYGPENMNLSGDIMGVASIEAEKAIGGVVQFANGAAGDIHPAGVACEQAPVFTGSTILAQNIASTRSATTTSSDVFLTTASSIVNFGVTQMNLTLARIADCSKGGPLDLCSMCSALHCDLNLHLGSSWLQESPRFSAVAFRVGGTRGAGGVTTAIATIPGEAIQELGFNVRDDIAALGFNQSIILGYAQAHMGYFTTAREYVLGGYESELSFWGVHTGDKIRAGCDTVLNQLKNY